MRVLWLTGAIVLIDQATKMLVVQTMYRSQSIPLLGDWLSLTYTENPGMAFGITFGPRSLITYFSIFATVVILAYLISIRKGYGPYRLSLALVLGGAFGNIIDRVFYGALIYGEPLFQGRVVDFIHVNVWRGYLPDSLPLVGGNYLALFPIWNVADMSIVLGVVGILFFQKRFHSQQAIADGKSPEAVPVVAAAVTEGAARPDAGVGQADTAPATHSPPASVDGAPKHTGEQAVRDTNPGSSVTTSKNAADAESNASDDSVFPSSSKGPTA